MDSLREHDIEASRGDTPGEKLAQALELMNHGYSVAASVEHDLLLFNPELLRLIRERGYNRKQDLEAKFEGLLPAIKG